MVEIYSLESVVDLLDNYLEIFKNVVTVNYNLYFELLHPMYILSDICDEQFNLEENKSGEDIRTFINFFNKAATLQRNILEIVYMDTLTFYYIIGTPQEVEFKIKNAFKIYKKYEKLISFI